MALVSGLFYCAVAAHVWAAVPAPGRSGPLLKPLRGGHFVVLPASALALTPALPPALELQRGLLAGGSLNRYEGTVGSQRDDRTAFLRLFDTSYGGWQAQAKSPLGRRVRAVVENIARRFESELGEKVDVARVHVRPQNPGEQQASHVHVDWQTYATLIWPILGEGPRIYEPGKSRVRVTEIAEGDAVVISGDLRALERGGKPTFHAAPIATVPRLVVVADYRAPEASQRHGSAGDWSAFLRYREKLDAIRARIERLVRGRSR